MWQPICDLICNCYLTYVHSNSCAPTQYSPAYNGLISRWYVYVSTNNLRVLSYFCIRRWHTYRSRVLIYLDFVFNDTQEPPSVSGWTCTELLSVLKAFMNICTAKLKQAHDSTWYNDNEYRIKHEKEKKSNQKNKKGRREKREIDTLMSACVRAQRERERGGGETDRQTDRRAGRQAGRQTDRRAGRQAGRQTDRSRQTETERNKGSL